MSNWFLRGVMSGIRTESIPDGDVAESLSPGLPVTTNCEGGCARDVAAACPTGAIEATAHAAHVDETRCVLCMRCKDALTWRHDVHWGHPTAAHKGEPLDRRFRQSLHVRIVDAGDCGSCLNELAQMNGPLYNLHRFGIFITPTPRQADVLLVVGPATRQMHDALRAAYDAMPEPKRVVAVGACAASGGIFGPSVMSAAGVSDVIPVDIVVPGCPPPPLAIVDALRLTCGQLEVKRT